MSDHSADSLVRPVQEALVLDTRTQSEPEPKTTASNSWYPSPPPSQSDVDEKLNHTDTKSKLATIAAESNTVALPPSHPVWTEGTLKYTNANKWQSIPNAKREACRRHRIHGVEVRKLPANHFLAGEYGLFATQKFSCFDILGEYTGKIVDSDISGHYVAALEDKGNDESLGIDAQTYGSELRFINSYLNVGFKANCSMRTAYVNTYPHIVIVCTEDIEVGDEFLLDYGEAYTKMFLTPKPKVANIPIETFRKALPGFASDSSRSSSDDEDSDNDSDDRIKSIEGKEGSK